MTRLNQLDLDDSESLSAHVQCIFSFDESKKTWQQYRHLQTNSSVVRMGSSSSKATTEQFQLEVLKDHYSSQEKVCGKAFRLCVDAPNTEASGYALTEPEVRCIREYAALYGDFQRKAMQHFSVNTEQMMREIQRMQGGRH